ncbi:MAG TPA: hypothetical protein VN089_18540 [Duganella sp.]|nr:hypothetical protein [Duganella sp.]
MAHTLAAVFEYRADAERAKTELLNAGFSSDSVRLASGTGTQTQPGTDDSTGGGIMHFFSNLFGTDDHADKQLYRGAINRGNTVLTINVNTDDEIERATDIIEGFGPLNVDEQPDLAGQTPPPQAYQSASQGAQSGAGGSMQDAWTAAAGTAQGAQAAASGSMQRTEEQAIPVIQEEPKVGKRTVQRGGVRVYQSVRSTKVEVEQLAPDLDTHFRTHWQSNYASAGGRYEDYDPAYRYGSSMRSSASYQGRPWNDVEPELRRHWESSHPQSAWDKFKAAVREGWDRMTS